MSAGQRPSCLWGRGECGVPINAAIDRAPRGTRLHGIAHVSDRSDQIVEVHALSCFSSVCCVLEMGVCPKITPASGCEAPMTSRPIRCFSAEELKLPATGHHGSCHHHAVRAVPILILYVGPCDLMLGRAPLFPLFLKATLLPPYTSVATPEGQRVPVRNHRRSRRGWP